MIQESLHRRLRPTRFDELVGQDYAAALLKNAVAHQMVSHAYLMCGLRGSGKTSSARILAAAVNCLNIQEGGEPCNECNSCEEIHAGRSLSVTELDAASNNSVADIRAVIEDASMPAMGTTKVYILDEAHMLTGAAANAMLKTLEEPPGGVMFILATTDPEKLLPTVLSRCQRVNFVAVSEDAVFELLCDVCSDIGFSADVSSLRQIARRCDGSIRDALSELDAFRTTGHAVTLSEDREDTRRAAREILALLEKNGGVGEVLSVVGAAVDQGIGAGPLGRAIWAEIRDGTVSTGAVPYGLDSKSLDMLSSAVEPSPDERLSLEAALLQVSSYRA